MLFINLTTGEITEDAIEAQHWESQNFNVESRSDWKTLERVTEVCNMFDQSRYMVVDAGESVYPRYDIIKKPQVGEDVSYAFNGDYREDGQIKSISKSMRIITTTTGSKYYRRKSTARWVRDSTWTLVYGHRNELNEEI